MLLSIQGASWKLPSGVWSALNNSRGLLSCFKASKNFSDWLHSYFGTTNLILLLSPFSCPILPYISNCSSGFLFFNIILYSLILIFFSFSGHYFLPYPLSKHPIINLTKWWLLSCEMWWQPWVGGLPLEYSSGSGLIIILNFLWIMKQKELIQVHAIVGFSYVPKEIVIFSIILTHFYKEKWPVSTWFWIKPKK